jgi:hypothetical protein
MAIDHNFLFRSKCRLSSLTNLISEQDRDWRLAERKVVSRSGRKESNTASRSFGLDMYVISWCGGTKLMEKRGREIGLSGIFMG